MTNDDDLRSRAERLDIFYRRMEAAKAAASHDEAMLLLNDTLNRVEDEFSGVCFDEERAGSDGRMYPPSEKFLVIPEFGVTKGVNG